MPPLYRTFRADPLEQWEWRVHARCRTEDPGLFFHPDGERGRARSRRQLRAKDICAECPVAAQCRDHALRYQEAFGTWGGLSEEERVRLLSGAAVNIRTHRQIQPAVIESEPSE